MNHFLFVFLSFGFLFSSSFLFAQSGTACEGLDGVFQYELDDQKGLWFCQGKQYLWILMPKERIEFAGDQATPEERAAAFGEVNVSTGSITCEGNKGTITHEYAKNPAFAGNSFQFEYERTGDNLKAWILQEDGSRGDIIPSRKIDDLGAKSGENCEGLSGFWRYELDQRYGIAAFSESYFGWILVSKEFWDGENDLSTDEGKTTAYNSLIAAAGELTCKEDNMVEWMRKYAKNYKVEESAFSTAVVIDSRKMTFYSVDDEGKRNEMGKAVRFEKK